MMESTLGRNLTEAAIRSELALILSNPELKRKTTLAKFLKFIVDESLAGRAHEIKGFTIATQVLGKTDRFDAVKDPTVRVLAGKLRAALDHYYLVFGARDPVQIEVPKGTYVPVFHDRSGQTVGLPSGLPSAQEAPPEALGLGIAVGSLRNLSGDPDTERLAEGLREELVAELFRYRNFPVVPCHSMTTHRNTTISARRFGRELNVRFVLEGSVRREGDCLKVAFALIDAKTGIQIWGERYRRDLGEGGLILLQEEIAAEAAGKLGDYYGVMTQQLTGEALETTREATKRQEAFVRMREYTFALTKETFAATLETLKQVGQRDPNSGMVWAMLANLYADDNTLWFGVHGVPMETALAYARKGAYLEPQNQYVRVILAYQHFLLGDRGEFVREADVALALNPNSMTLTAFLGWLMALHGQWDRGLDMLGKGMAASPQHPGWFYMAPCLHQYAGGQYEAAYQHALKIRTPRLLWDPMLRAAALGRLGRSAEARAALEELLDTRPDFPSDARRRIGFFVKAAEHAEGLLEGLKLAGLVI